MHRYHIKHGYQLQSHPNKVLLRPGQYYETDKEGEIAELGRLATEGGCIAVGGMVKPSLQPTNVQASKPAKEKAEPTKAPENPDEDITVVPGVGAKLKSKLEDEGITTKTHLRDLVKNDAAKAKTLLGLQFDKIKASLLSD